MKFQLFGMFDMLSGQLTPERCGLDAGLVTFALPFQRLSFLQIQEGISDPWYVGVEGRVPKSREHGVVILSEDGSACPGAQPSLGVIWYLGRGP